MSLEYGILGFLSHKELTGYELKKAFDISCAFVWSVNQGQIYRTLEAMLKKDWVAITETSPGLSRLSDQSVSFQMGVYAGTGFSELFGAIPGRTSSDQKGE